MKMSHFAAAIGLAAVTSFSNAAVTFDSGTGKGFVGKGDVQLAFGMNNDALQKSASAISFSYNVTTEYLATCTWYTGPEKKQKVHNVKFTEIYNVTDGIATSTRVTGQVTGFNLNGWDASLHSVVGAKPERDGSCPGEGTDGTWTEVVEVGEGTDALMVNFGGQSVALTITPVL